MASLEKDGYFGAALGATAIGGQADHLGAEALAPYEEIAALRTIGVLVLAGDVAHVDVVEALPLGDLPRLLQKRHRGRWHVPQLGIGKKRKTWKGTSSPRFSTTQRAKVDSEPRSSPYLVTRRSVISR